MSELLFCSSAPRNASNGSQRSKHRNQKSETKKPRMCSNDKINTETSNKTSLNLPNNIMSDYKIKIDETMRTNNLM